MTEKTCTQCGVTKPLSSFYAQKTGRGGVRSWCKPCDEEKKVEARADGRTKRRKHKPQTPEQNRKNALHRRFKMTPEDWDALLESQGGGCAACGETESGRHRFHVDHDHNCCSGEVTCGKCIRGLLCEHCNKALGHVHDNPQLLRKLAHYLEDFADAA
jgi:hypothetical protein